MSIQNWWSDARIDKAKEILGTYPRWCENCRVEIGDVLGRDVSYDSLRDALRRRGLGPPGTFCTGSPLVVDCDLSELYGVESCAHEPADRIRRVALIGDVHEPYTDAEAKRLGLSVLREFNPEIVATMGDTIDCYAISDHDRDPTRVALFDQEVDAANRFLDELERATPNATRRIYVEGNHEFRLPRYLKRKAPALFNLVQMPKLLKIGERGLEWVPYYQSTRIGYLNVTHECGSAGRFAHIKGLDAFQGNVAMGHTHQLAIQYGGSATLDTHVSVMCGWWGSMDGIDWMHKVNARHWNHGLVVGYLEPSGVIHLQTIPFIKGRKLTACLNGELVRAA